MPNRPAALLVLALLAVALPARAGDGRVEINQARALAGGITPGDTANFPITLSASGSYVLTGNLTVTNPDVDAINVTADDVSIDLNGLTIAGPTICTGTGTTLTCFPGLGSGIDATGRSRIAIRNGRVRGFASTGIITGTRAEVRDIVAESNGGNGVATGSVARVHGVNAGLNRGYGIGINTGSVVEASVASSNWGAGINGGSGLTILGCAAYDNGADGMFVGASGVVRDSSAYLNEGDGIDLGSGSLVSDSAANNNGEDGIETSSGSTVQRSAVRANGAFGLNLGAESTYRENTITGNAGGTVTGSGINMASNSCDGASTCP